MACTNHTKRVRFCGNNRHGGFVRNFSNHVVGCLGPSRPIDGVLLEHHIDVQSQGKKRPFPLRPDGPCGHGRTTMPDESLPPTARRRCCPAGRRKSKAMGGQGRIVAHELVGPTQAGLVIDHLGHLQRHGARKTGQSRRMCQHCVQLHGVQRLRLRCWRLCTRWLPILGLLQLGKGRGHDRLRQALAQMRAWSDAGMG